MIAPEGWPFVVTPACLGTATIVLGAPPAGWGLIALGAFALLAFRAPVRDCPAGPAVACAPADGRVHGVTPAPRELVERGLGLCLTIAGSPFDPLVTRAPVAGRIVGDLGGVAVLAGSDGPVGLRHLPHGKLDAAAADGRLLDRGARVGLRRPRSAVALYLPRSAALLVRAGDRVRAGATPVAEMGRNE